MKWAERALHILNPSARFRADVEKKLPLPAPDVHVWVQYEHPYHTETIIRWGLQEGFRSFIVWGGDGTLHRVVQSFGELDLWAKAALGVIPVGTCNDLARHLGLHPGDVDGALRITKSAQPKKIDVGTISWTQVPGQKSSCLFINNAGFGRDPAAIREKWGPVRNALSFKPHKLCVETDEQTHEGEFLMGVICNGPFFSGGLRFSSGTSCVDGRLDGFLPKPAGPFGLLTRLALARLGRPLADSKTLCIGGKEISVRSEDGLWPQADGEALTKQGVRELEFTVMPNKLQFLVSDTNVSSSPAKAGDPELI